MTNPHGRAARVRWRRWIASAACIMLLALSAAWGLSTRHRSGIRAEAEWVVGVSTSPDAQGAVAQFAERHRRVLEVGQSAGQVYFSLGAYTSDIDANDLDWLNKNDALGQHLSAFNERINLQDRAAPDTHPRVYWNGWTDFAFHGLGIRNHGRFGYDNYVATAPHWMIVVVLACSTTWLARPLVRRAVRRRRGRCADCGYDRRGLAPGSPCPECGGASPPEPRVHP